MPHLQEYDGIQISFEDIKYAPFTGILWHTTIFWRHKVCSIHRNMMAYRYLLKASSMPDSQEFDGIQLSFEGIKYAPFTGIWWHTTIFWRHQVCPIHRNLVAYRYLLKASSLSHLQEYDGKQITFEGIKYAPFTGIWWHTYTFEGIKYVPFTGIWWQTDNFWRHQVCPIHRNMMAYIYFWRHQVCPIYRNMMAYNYFLNV